MYKLYKKIKYGTEDKDVKETIGNIVDPVNHYILSKNYTNKVRMSSLQRIKKIIEKRKNVERVEKLFKEKEAEDIEFNEKLYLKREKKPEEAKSNFVREEMLEENRIKIDEEDDDDDLMDTRGRR